MTLPKTSNLQEDDSDYDIFGPPKEQNFFKRRGVKLSMISSQYRLREIRKKILQMSLDKLDKIKDSERNLRRSVLIHEVYCRLIGDNLYDEKSQITNDLLYEDIRREKQNKYMSRQNLDKFDDVHSKKKRLKRENSNNNIENYSNNPQKTQQSQSSSKLVERSSACSDSDLEKLLDPEFISNPSNLDPEITHSAEQLEQALVSRKRKLNDASVCGMNVNLTEEDNDRLVREALSQFYLPATRLLSAIEELPLLTQQEKRQKLDLNLELSQNYQNSSSNLSNKYNNNNCSNNNNNNLNICGNICGQSSLLDTSNLFHSFTVASLET